MPSFNPNTIILDLDDEPFKDGQIKSADARAQVNAIRAKLLAVEESEKPFIQEELHLAIKSAQPSLTVGSAIVHALTMPLPDQDDKSGQRVESLDGEEKTDLLMMAIRIKKAMSNGEHAMVTFSEKEMTLIKKRVSRAYPSPLIVGRVYESIVQGEV
jgi:hypothetical protein